MPQSLAPAAELARREPILQLNESAEYRAARTALLEEEIELRRHMERVAEQRRALPPGPEVTRDYRFKGAEGEVSLADLFGEHDTLVVYNFMYGPERPRPCPMCTNLLGAWEGNAADIMQRVALAVIARSPIERLTAWKRERGWRNLRLYSDTDDSYFRDYHGFLPDGSETAALHVFTRRDGKLRLFWGDEMGMNSGDPGQDPRGAAAPNPLWAVLDLTPEGRGEDWYPKLDYRN